MIMQSHDEQKGLNPMGLSLFCFIQHTQHHVMGYALKRT